jgi:hypothetical protein
MDTVECVAMLHLLFSYVLSSAPKKNSVLFLGLLLVPLLKNKEKMEVNKTLVCTTLDKAETILNKLITGECNKMQVWDLKVLQTVVDVLNLMNTSMTTRTEQQKQMYEKIKNRIVAFDFDCLDSKYGQELSEYLPRLLQIFPRVSSLSIPVYCLPPEHAQAWKESMPNVQEVTIRL